MEVRQHGSARNRHAVNTLESWKINPLNRYCPKFNYNVIKCSSRFILSAQLSSTTVALALV